MSGLGQIPGREDGNRAARQKVCGSKEGKANGIIPAKRFRAKLTQSPMKKFAVFFSTAG